eukprot:SAG11_NODE_3116_length_2674_cov_4.690097_3_plen_212_part_00
MFAAEIERLTNDVAESVAAGAGAASTDAPIVKPLSIVVFGATGDLAREKLYPSFQQLMLKGLLPYGSTIMAYGRSAVTMDDFCAKQLVKVAFTSEEEEAKFKASLDYFQGGYDDEGAFADLDKALSAKEAPGSDRLYFLSVPPTVFGDVCTCIDKNSRAHAPGKTQVRGRPLSAAIRWRLKVRIPAQGAPIADGRCWSRSRSAATRARSRR